MTFHIFLNVLYCLAKHHNHKLTKIWNVITNIGNISDIKRFKKKSKCYAKKKKKIWMLKANLWPLIFLIYLEWFIIWLLWRHIMSECSYTMLHVEGCTLAYNIILLQFETWMESCTIPHFLISTLHTWFFTHKPFLYKSS